MTEQLKALGEENRFRIVMMLRQRPLCACEILQILNIAGATLSTHLKILRTAGVIIQEKQGRWIEYSLEKGAINDLIEYLYALIRDRENIDSDYQRLGQISRNRSESDSGSLRNSNDSCNDQVLGRKIDKNI